MCEFCLQHGEGKKWYENAKNYSEELFYQINSPKEFKSFAEYLSDELLRDVQRAYKWKKRIPYLYTMLVYPLITRHLKKIHFGQIVPLEDIEKVLDNTAFIIRLPCICRKLTIHEEKRYCIGLGFEFSHLLDDTPDFSTFDTLSKRETKEFIAGLDTEGKAHSIWTFKTPFIGAICNCDRDCMAYHVQIEKKLARTMWKGEYVATIDKTNCNGCKQCMDRCYFEAITYDRNNKKCHINRTHCYGCGICRTVCNKDAITLSDRHAFIETAHLW
jgi:ferredoxin